MPRFTKLLTLRRLSISTAATATVVLLPWLALGLFPKPLLVNRGGFSQAVHARDGRLLRLTLSSDEKYRLWVPIGEMPRVLIDTTLLQEDAWFHEHPGVNPLSLVRAFLTTYVSHARRIGGSTITMQLARMRFGIDSRTARGKLVQIVRALELERSYSKSEILEAYLNLAPYGGNVEGVGAASLVYFGKEPSRLSLPEALTLAVIPQSPSARRPIGSTGDSALAAARLRLFERWAAKGASSGASAAVLAVTASRRSGLPFLAPHFVDRVLKSDDRSTRIATTLDLELQELLERELQAFVRRNRKLGIANGAVIAVDYRTMEVRGYVGSADHSSEPIAGQVDGLRGRRSPGSALKPFIYALAIDEGLIHPQTVLKDTSLRISAYNPENFDRDFVGPIDATDALVRSRNVPAILLANRLEPPGLYGFLKQAGVGELRDESFYGLALALGGVDLTMEEVAGLYAMLANGGIERPLLSRLDARMESTPAVRLLSPDASLAVLEMLRTNPRPSEDSDTAQLTRSAAIPWKTGTSYGFRDAWAVGIVGPYVLGVWIGNFDGRPNPNFVGREAAGPLFFAIADAMRARGPLIESIVHDTLSLRKVKVCALSGDLPGPHCDHLKETWFIPGKSPIRTCAVHREVEIDLATRLRACPGDSAATASEVFEFWPSDLLKLFRTAGVPRRVPPPFSRGCRAVAPGGAPVLIASPARGLDYSLGTKDRNEIPLTAITDADGRNVYWFIDDRLVGTARSGESLFWTARPGRFVVRAVDDQGRSVAEELNVSSSGD
jgi:penicillin-binding protein 1C